MPTAKPLQCEEDRIAGGAQVTMVSQVQLVTARIETNVKRRDHLTRGVRAFPSPFTSDRNRNSDEPAQSLQHPLMP